MHLNSSFAHSSRLHVISNGTVVSNVTVNPGSATYTLLAGLTPSETYSFTVWYITDPIALSWPDLPPLFISVSWFAIDSGTFGPSPAPRTRRLQIIGDSITAGNQIDKATCEPDHHGTYGAKLCERFEASCQTLAISGKGIYENCCDANETMTELYKRVIAGSPTPLFNDADFQPDAVLLNLGTNDQNHNNGSAWVQGFITTYADFLVNLTVTHNNPKLPIFCGVGPITHEYNPWVVQAMSLAAARGVASLTLVNYTTILDGCGHPGWVGHEQMFEIAEPIISAVLGWK